MAAGRGRKVTTVFVVLLLVLFGLFMAADRVAAYAAAQQLASQAQKQLAAREISTPDKPHVVIGGFPFLTQVARGRYDRVTIHATNLTGQGVTIDSLDVLATGINAKTSTLINRQGTVTADNVTGTGRLGWAAVTKLIKTNGTGLTDGVAVAPLGDGQIQMTAPVKLLGLSTTVVATGTVQVAGSEIRVRVTQVRTQGGDVPSALSALLGTLKTALSVNLRIPPLPYNLKITDVQSTTAGIVVHGNAQNVALSAGPGA